MNLRKENRYTAEMDEEIREKLDFFWDDCEPEIEADVVDSIREKVLRRIRPLQEEAVGLPKRKKPEVCLSSCGFCCSICSSVGRFVAELWRESVSCEHMECCCRVGVVSDGRGQGCDIGDI